jgi:hypothetical protein
MAFRPYYALPCPASSSIYTPQPATVKAPEKELEETVNLAAEPPVKVEVTDTYVKAVWAGLGHYAGIVTRVVRYSGIVSMTLVQSVAGLNYDPGFVVQVRDGSGYRFPLQGSGIRAAHDGHPRGAPRTSGEALTSRGLTLTS